MNSAYSQHDAEAVFYAHRQARQRAMATRPDAPTSPKLLGRLACLVLGHRWAIPRRHVTAPGGWAPLPVLRCSRCGEAWSVEIMERDG